MKRHGLLKRMYPGTLRLMLLVCLCALIIMPALAQEETGDDAVAAASQSQAGQPEEVIAAYPEPNVTPLEIDDELIYSRAYRKVTGAYQTYDAPGGAIVDNYGAGYVYVTAGADQGGFSPIGRSKWIPTEQLVSNVSVSRFGGVLLPEAGLPYPMAWMLRNTKPSARAGEEPLEDTELIARYTRVNIYDTARIDGKNWYQVGVDQWVHQHNVAKILPVERPAEIETTLWVSIDLYEQVLIAYNDETPVYATLVSSGLTQWSTNEGVFNVYSRWTSTSMGGAYGQEDFYYLQEVPYTMYFDNDIGLHGTYWHDGFGYRQSHGCVNLSITDSRWLYNWSLPEYNADDKEDPDLGVYVYSSGEYD